MSATGRNLTGAERHPDDFYATPGWATRALLHELWGSGSGLSMSGPPERIFEPCCGEGAILKEVRNWRPNAYVAGIELSESRARVARDFATNAHVQVCDALKSPEWWIADPHLIVTNPPYKLAAEFIECAIEAAKRRGHVAMLLRVNYLGSQERAPWHRRYPSDVLILPKRPSFVGHLKWKTYRCGGFVENPKKPRDEWAMCQMEANHDGDCRTLGTDATEYAWFVWGPGRGQRWKILEVEK